MDLILETWTTLFAFFASQRVVNWGDNIKKTNSATPLFKFKSSQFSLTPQFFQLSIEDLEKTAEGYDELCLPQINTPNFKSDFLSIPGGRTNNAEGVAVSVNRFCGTSLVVGTPVVTVNPGPFVLQFTSDLISSPEERGFRFTYILS